MSFFDNLANNMSGKNRSSDSDYSSYSSNSYGSNPLKGMRTFQCQYCGRMERKVSPQSLPTSGCPSRGLDRKGFPQKHVWSEI